MGFDPATMAAVASFAGKVAGDKQLGGIAPPSNTPASPPSDLLTGLQDGLGLPSTSAISLLAQQGNFGNPLQQAQEGLAGPGGTPIQPELEGPPELKDDPTQGGGLLGGIGNAAGGFFGNLDQNLQSPSKVIGLGLLNRLDPRLGLAGLLGGGLLGKNKVF